MASGIDYAAIMSPNGAAAGLGNFAAALSQLPQQRRANQLTAMRQDLESRRLAMDLQGQTNQQQFQAGQFQRQVGLDAQNAQMAQGHLAASQAAGAETVRHNQAEEGNYGARTAEMLEARKLQQDQANQFHSTLDADKYFTEEVPGPLVDHYNALLGTTDKIQTKTRVPRTGKSREQGATDYSMDVADEYDNWKKTHTGRSGQPASGPPVDVSVPTNVPPTPVDEKTAPVMGPPSPGAPVAAAPAGQGGVKVVSMAQIQSKVGPGKKFPTVEAAVADAQAHGFTVK